MRGKLIVLLIVPWLLGTARGLEVVPPDTPLEPGEFTMVMVEGLSPQQIPQARVIHWPRERVVAIPAMMWGGAPFVFFSAKLPGKYLLAVAVANGDGQLSYAEAVLEVGQPDPSPDPDPDPPDELWGVVVEETGMRTAAQAQVLASTRVRALFESGRFRVIDKDIVDRDGNPPAHLVNYLNRAKGKTLPYLTLISGDSEVLWEGPLPATVDEMCALVGRFLPAETDWTLPQPSVDLKPVPRGFKRVCEDGQCWLVPITAP